VQAGSIHALGRELSNLSPRELVEVRRGIGFIFQAHNLFDSLTARENVNMAIELTLSDARERDRRAQEILERVGLGHRMEHKPQALSGGQRQRVAIARALVNRPSIILADEPTGNLDSKTGLEIMALFDSLHAKGNTIVLVTHEPDIAEYAHRVVHIRDGQIFSDEPSKRFR
jgi:putative ABC transport system ATP-binding protein